MAFRFFCIPAVRSEAAEAELNAFLRAHRVVELKRRWVDQGSNSFWSFAVEYLDASAGSAAPFKPMPGKGKIDYREKFLPEDFAVFSKLRELRKLIAQDETVPVYTIFTNDQLAQMVEMRTQTKAALKQIAGLAEARIEKYGDRVLKLLQQEWKDSDAKSGPAV